MVKKFWNRAFTVAEVLITIVIIGVVAVITINVLRISSSDIEQRVARAKMMDSVSTALGTMQLDNNLAGYADTQAFAAQFANYYDAEPMTQEEISQMQTTLPEEARSALGESPVYLKTPTGEVLAISYNPNYVPDSSYTKMASDANTTATDSVEFRNESMNAISGFYDTNGVNNGPNKIGKDINLIQPYAAAKGGVCDGNYVLDPNGGDCICSITRSECVTMGKTFDAGACTCEANCPVGKVFSEEAGACVCSLTAESCVAPYSEFDAESCSCKATIGASAKCIENGGTWDATRGNCVCKAPTDEDSCEAKSFGYAQADPLNFCKCACKPVSQIQSEIQARANGRVDKTQVIKYTVPTADVENNCVYCAAKDPKETTYDIEMENGLCVTKSLVAKDPLCVEPFCEWVDYPKYYNKCIISEDACQKILDKAHDDYYGYAARSNDCMTDSRDKCRANVDACIKDPHSSACKNSMNECSNLTSTPHYGCAMRYAWRGSISNAKLTPVKPRGEGPMANATVDNCYCAVQQGVINASVPRNYAFHGASGIAEENRWTKFTGYDLPAFNGAYMDSERQTPSDLKNVMILESYDSWYDPIILNVGNADAFAAPKTTEEINVPFKDYEGDDILTAWVARYVNPSYYFLVNDLNENNQVDNLSELYSEAGGYITGLEMLNEDFDRKAADKVVLSYPELARKGLKTWADMNSNAKVDSGDVFEDVLVLKAEEKTEKVLVKKGNSYYDAKKDKYVTTPDKYEDRKYYEFTEITGTGVYEIYTGYTMLSTTSGTPERSGNSTVAIQSKYTIFKPVNSLSPDKTWVEMRPTKAGENPDVEYVFNDYFSGKAKNAGKKDVLVYQDTGNRLLTGVQKLVWTYKFKNVYAQNIGVYIKVNGKLYAAEIRGLTDVIFDKL